MADPWGELSDAASDASVRGEDAWQGVMDELASPAGSCDGAPNLDPGDGGGWGALSPGDDMDMSGASDCEVGAAAIVPVAGAPHVVEAVSADTFGHSLGDHVIPKRLTAA